MLGRPRETRKGENMLRLRTIKKANELISLLSDSDCGFAETVNEAVSSEELIGDGDYPWDTA